MRPIVGLVIAGAVLLAGADYRNRDACADRAVGMLEVRLTDHRPGIADFRWLEVAVGRLAIHRTGGGRREGWVEVVAGVPAIDIVPLKDGVWRPLGEASVPAGEYDAVRVQFDHARGELLSGSITPVLTEDTVVRLNLSVPEESTRPVVLDLFAEDQTDHEPQRYVVKVKEVRLAGSGRVGSTEPEGSE